MRRALKQPRFSQIEVTGGQIWGVISQSTYDPFDLYERGMAPHLAFASAKDPLQWHKEFGPLFGFTSAYSSTVEQFGRAQRRFVALLRLWQAWSGKDKDIGECFLQATRETGIVALPGHGTVLGLRQEWTAESQGTPSFVKELAGEEKDRRISVKAGGKDSYDDAAKFARSASGENLRQAAEDLLKLALVVRLRDIQPDFQDQRGFEPTWTVRDLLQAFYLMLFFDMTKRRAVRGCKECGQFFYPSGKRARFCSTDCARRSRQRRYWNRRGKLLRRKRRRTKQ